MILLFIGRGVHMSQNKSASLDMTKGNPASLLIRFAIPMLIGGIFQLLSWQGL